MANSNFIYIKKDIYKQLTEVELLIYCFGAFQPKTNEDYTFSSSILNRYLNANTKRDKAKIKNALVRLITKGLIIEDGKDVYIIHRTKKPEENNVYYFVLYDIEFEALKFDSKLLNYFCYLVSCFDNVTQQYKMANSFIQNGFNVSKATVLNYNDILQKLNLIQIVSDYKKDTHFHTSNIIKRVNVNDAYKEVSKDKGKIAEVKKTKAEPKIKTKDLSIAKETNNTKSNTTNNIFDKAKLKQCLADVIGVNESDIKINHDRLKKIEEAGQDNFISILKSNIPKYTTILYGSEFQNNPQYKVNTILKRIFENDFERELKEMKNREQEFQNTLNKHVFTSDAEAEYFSNYMNNTENENLTIKPTGQTDLSWVLDNFEEAV